VGLLGRAFCLILLFALPAAAAAAGGTGRSSRSPATIAFEPRTLDGSGNNPGHPEWGQAGTPYLRLARPRYADGTGSMVAGPNPRFVSNRVFNSLGVDLFSQRSVSQWAWVWGQFLDHTFGLAKSGAAGASIPFSATDPLESFKNDLGSIPFSRNAVAPGTGTSSSNPRQQVNTLSSYIDASAVYGVTQQRLGWLRDGAHMLLPGGYLPRATARGDASTAPSMVIDGQLTVDPQNAVVAGDVRANENAELLAVQTLFIREHNRIVDGLPSSLTAEQ